MPNFLVFLQFLLLAICFYPWSNPYQINWGVALLALAAIIGLYTLTHNRLGNFSIRPVYKPGGKLILSGPYRFFRHPMYITVLLSSVGVVVMQQHVLKMIVVILLWVVLDIKARLEEKAMTNQFPEYRVYKMAGFRWLPFIQPTQPIQQKESEND